MESISITTKKGKVYNFTKLNWDVNGNRLYHVSATDLGLANNSATPATKKAGLKRYSGTKYSQGFIFQSGNLQWTAERLEEEGL